MKGREGREGETISLGEDQVGDRVKKEREGKGGQHCSQAALVETEIPLSDVDYKERER